ncbi:MAG: NUDIX hydrolase [Spirochaetaceae bacterium]|jgi:8-oxo-dGTP pyrophosphatase MutT (NUDIX family)|nr:NUDIX hydrolase [Spirochaetaceae bacterium]
MEKIAWREIERKKKFESRVFNVSETLCAPPDEKTGPSRFTVIESKEWAVIIPVLDGDLGREFLMVRQWRHGASRESLEFPGGVIEEGEEVEAGAKRELREETGFLALKFTKIAEVSPNPAIMSNRLHFFLAEDLIFDGEQRLDEDEYVSVERRREEEVFRDMGRPPYIHVFMAAALHFYRMSKESAL